VGPATARPVLTASVQQHARHDGPPLGLGRRATPAEDVQEALRRIFVCKFLRPDDFAGAPIDFSGIAYDEDGLLVDGTQPKAAAHLIGAIRGLGYEIVFEDPGADVPEAIRHIVWDKWSKDEIGEHQFISRLFDRRGQIYRGYTAFDAARYTLQRLAAVGGRLCSGHQP
jgi:hypothetical protein